MITGKEENIDPEKFIINDGNKKSDTPDPMQSVIKREPKEAIVVCLDVSGSMSTNYA